MELKNQNLVEKLKPEFKQRMQELLQEDYQNYCKVLEQPYLNSIRCNTLKISPEKLSSILEKKWKIKQPFSSNPEIIIIESSKSGELEPGEIGRALEHQLGYYYIQEISSMMPPITLNPKPDEIILDLAASPGSKTTQISAIMQNSGTLIANDLTMPRIKILASNTQKTSSSNILITRADGAHLCEKLAKQNFKFDKILADVPCSGEGTLRTSPKTANMFNQNIIKKMSNTQKRITVSALKALKLNGEMIYSTCTHAPEENEEIISYLLENFPIKLQEIKIPLKTRPGIIQWQDKKYNPEVKKCARIYPQDNNTEGFFLAKIKKTGEIK